jgi:phage terminase large subunit-like protein
MPWQRLVADVGLELADDGNPAYREVVCTVPRQNGKTTLILGWEVQRAVGWAAMLGTPQRIVYSAQTGSDASKKLVEDQFPLLEPHRRLLGIRQFVRSNGKEQVVWANGSRVGLLASLEDSGHGKTVHLGVKDELFADTDDRRDQALIPAMATVASAQTLSASTAGTADSVAWNAKLELGRSAVRAGRRSGVAFFEWSAEPDADPADPATWWSCMPALGRTIGLPVVEHAYETLKLDEFRRAFLNIATAAEERLIPQTAWDLVCTPDVEATAVVFGLDVNPERSAAAIVAAGPGVVEVVDYRAGVGWLVERVVELHGRYRAPFALDVAGPAGSFLADLQRAQVPLLEVSGRDLPRMAGGFYDQVVNGTVRIRRHEALDTAAAAAARRPVGDAWTWGRKSSAADISPLVAATVALGTIDRVVSVADNVW